MSRKVKGKKRNPLMSSSGLARTGVTGGADIRRGLTWGKSGKLTRVCKERSEAVHLVWAVRVAPGDAGATAGLRDDRAKHVVFLSGWEIPC